MVYGFAIAYLLWGIVCSLYYDDGGNLARFMFILSLITVITITIVENLFINKKGDK